jgi:hypothetical protein
VWKRQRNKLGHPRVVNLFGRDIVHTGRRSQGRVKRIFFWALAATASLAIRGVALPSEAYVWQRQWTPDVVTALGQSGNLFDGWRVLVAETDTPKHLRPFAVDWQALAATRKPVKAVIRIDGHIALLGANFAAQIASFETTWRMQRIRLAGIEIDYDCGVARLSEYADFLTALRRSLPKGQRLSITALPSWIDHPDFVGVIAAADEMVLQVHAVRAPQKGLFDAKVAEDWIADLASKDRKPFRVALPDYSTRVIRGDKGEIVAVESEAPRFVGGASAEDLAAMPADVADLVNALDRARPEQMVGFVWFRLPVVSDQRTWSLTTLAAAMRGTVPPSQLTARLRPGGVAGAFDIVLTNDGEIDAPLPAHVDAPDCTFADGVNGFTLTHAARGISLRRLQIGTLRAHHEQIIGWTRCRGNLNVAN